MIVFRDQLFVECQKFASKINRRIYVARGSFGKAWFILINGKMGGYVEKYFLDPNDVKCIAAEICCMTIPGNIYAPKLVFCGFNREKRWCIVSEYIEGQTLLFHIRMKSKISPEAKQTILYHIALALEFLHVRNLTHGLVYDFYRFDRFPFSVISKLITLL